MHTYSNIFCQWQIDSKQIYSKQLACNLVIYTFGHPSNTTNFELLQRNCSTVYILKVGFFQKVLAKFSTFSKCHSCEPKIVPELLIPVNDNNKILVILWINLVIKSPHYKIWLKNANYMDEFNCLQCLQS